ncbi:uncharacterized protein LOC123424358 [Hordeum vulgare subsp. vulgare]|nr:uncharacterized protein LOC123424358 [Hordeum vulgare subsp. vulgare]
MASSGTSQSGHLPPPQQDIEEPDEAVPEQEPSPPVAAQPAPQQEIEEPDEAVPEQEPSPLVAAQPAPQQEIEEPDEAVPEQEIEEPDEAVPEQEPSSPVAPQPPPQQEIEKQDEAVPEQEIEEPDETVPEQEPSPPVAIQPPPQQEIEEPDKAVLEQEIEEPDEAVPEQEPSPPVAPQPPPQQEIDEVDEAVIEQEIEEPDESVPEQEPSPPVAPQPPPQQEIEEVDEVAPGQEPLPQVAPEPAPREDQEPAPGDGSTKVRMFAEFFDLPKKTPHWRWPWATRKAIRPEMLMRVVRCGHCQKLEDLSRPQSPIEPDHRVTVSVLPDQIAFEGNSCLTCVKMIYEKTRPSLEQVGSDTPLHYAARSRNFKMLFHFICLIGDEYGLERVAQVLRKLNGRRETALHEAIWQGNKYMADFLMRVDPKLAGYPPAGTGTSPLYLAISLGYTDIAQMLYSTRGGNLSYSGPDGQNALHAAVLHSQDMIKPLLDRNEDLSKEMDENGSTPLHCVVLAQTPFIRICSFPFPAFWFPSQSLPTGRVLHANTSAACQPDKNGLFPVHIAAMMNSRIAIHVLLTLYPRCIGFPDNQGRSFLHIAAQNKNSLVVRYACSVSRRDFGSIMKSIMNAQDDDGNTALHLAVDAGDLSSFCALLGNREVLLNIRNNKNQTPLDLAWSKRKGFAYGWNPEHVMYRTLVRAGSSHASFWRDRLQQLCNLVPLESQEDEEKDLAEKKEDEGKDPAKEKKEDEEKEESAKVTDSTRTLGIGSVLIASVTFTATFTVPAGIKASDHTKDGRPGLLGMWYYNAFMMANTLAFICSSIATVGLMYAGMPLVKLPIRRRHFVGSVFFASSSLTCLNIAFALGVYMVLAPVSRETTIAICVFTPLVLIYRNAEHLHKMVITWSPIYVRRGFMFACWSFIWSIFMRSIMEFWPFVAIFTWAAHRKTSSTVA